MADGISTTRSGKEFKGEESLEELEEFYTSPRKEKNSSEELDKPKTEELGMSDFTKLLQFMLQQEQKREQERKEEKKRYEKERREEKERYEQERREEKERYERNRRLEIERQERLEKERRAEREELERERQRERQRQEERFEQLELQRKEELKRLENVMKLKEVNMTKLNPTDDIENYLTTFERTAKTFEWPKEKWVVKLVPYLTGKAQAAYAAMSIAESNDYDKVKEAILKRYDITEETYRQRFRSVKKLREESYKEMYVRLKDLFRKWTKPDGKTVEEITETVIMEQLVDTMPPGVQIWVREHRPKTGIGAATLADDYYDARKGVHNDLYRRPQTNSEKPVTAPKDNEKEGIKVNQPENSNSAQPGRSHGKPRCRNCNKEGHTERNCYKPRRTGYLSKRNDRCPYKDFIIPGQIEGQNVEMVLDSGCDMTLVHQDLVDPKKINHRERTHLRCIHDHHSDYPTAEVIVEINGEPFQVVVGVSKDLPRHALLGKDFPTFYDLLNKVQPVAQHSLVVTRAQAKRKLKQRKSERKEEKRCQVKPNNLESIAVPEIYKEFGDMDVDSFMDTPPKVKVHKSRSQKRQQRKEHSQMKSKTKDQELEAMDIDHKSIKDLQMADTTLDSLRRQEVKQNKDEEIQIIYKEGIMYRQVFKRELPEPIEQLILPKQCRQNVLKVSHDIPLAGHLGTKKTLDRIRQRFYWPNMTKDVKNYCKSCETCQITSKHGTKFRAPMQSMPIIEEPFKRIAMDIVGPLERSRSGNKYILVICDYATRYPEAIPLRSIEAKKIADELIKLFSKVGIPQEILTDQGSNFTSKLLKEIYKLLHIKGITTAPYHPQTDGMVERLNGTLKAMIRKFTVSDPHNWDQLVPYLLFAYREVPQESTGFSPFELLYGRKVRGPLDVMKETWTGTVSGPKSVVSHIVTMRERLASMTDLVKENMKEAQLRQKKWYDTKSKAREFSPGQEVLLLLPSSSNALQAKWQGPFKVVRKVGPVDYEIATNHKGRKLKVYHVNLLKEFKRRNMDGFSAISSVIGDEEGEDTDVSWRNEDSGLDITVNNDLSDEQKVKLTALVNDFKTVLSNKPGKTTVIEHDIEMKKDAVPVRQRPYPIPQAKIEKVKQEVQAMLELDVIEESNSPWSSPYVMVPKPDGTKRFCVNFKKVNSLSKFDAYPMPRIEEIISRLGPSKYITKLDLCKGYWQVPLSERSKQYTAFSTPLGLYQFKYLPFGLHGAPATFQRMMDRLLKGKEEYGAAYMDDLVVFSSEFDEHLEHLKEILETLQEANLTVKPSKCSFAQSKVNYLGYLVGNGNLEPQQTKIAAVLKWEQPKTKKDVKSFLGLTGYYRKFVPNYAEVAAPLTDLTTKKKPEKVIWTPDCEKAFEDLKTALCSDPVLRNPDFNKEFVLQTDASERGLGAVLSQYDDEGNDHPVLYLSRKLLPREQNYATIEKECLAIKWAICSLQYYLLGREFTIVTDHQPLRWLNEMKDNNKRLTRWSLDLQPYCYKVIHRKGLSNGNADGLSRISEP